VRDRTRKGPNAFRTISEVADELHVPQHVLRFWETKFLQVKPLKRGGGRRYYRPDDVALLRRISNLLYVQGYTIKGVQRLLRESGGTLGDNIPPPSAEDMEPEDDTLLPLPGLTAGPVRSRGPLDVPPLPQKAESGADAEVRRLRAVLAETLLALEILRDQVGAR
jgi:DNA-binding transcriptional MerR regulator